MASAAEQMWLFAGAGGAIAASALAGWQFFRHRRASGQTIESGRYQRIVVLRDASTPDDHGVGARLAKSLASSSGTVTFVYALDVPRALPLAASLPDEERIAAARLQEDATLASGGSLRIATQIRRCRTVGDEIVRAVTEHKAELLIVVTDMSGAAALNERASQLPCELLIERLPVR